MLENMTAAQINELGIPNYTTDEAFSKPIPSIGWKILGSTGDLSPKTFNTCSEAYTEMWHTAGRWKDQLMLIMKHEIKVVAVDVKP